MKAPTRDERLAKALRDNLARRKARAREAGSIDPSPVRRGIGGGAPPGEARDAERHDSLPGPASEAERDA